MTVAARRVQLEPAYLLHHYPFRESSRILELFTRRHGRVSLFAREVWGDAKAPVPPDLVPGTYAVAVRVRPRPLFTRLGWSDLWRDQDRWQGAPLGTLELVAAPRPGP